MRELRTLNILFFLTALASAEPLPTLTLNDALRLASGRNLQVLASSKEIERQKSIWDADAATRLPRVAVEARRTHLLNSINFNILPGSLGSFPATGPIPSDPVTLSNVSGSQNTIQLTVTQPLTQLHKITLGLEAQEEAIEDARQKTGEI